MGRGTLRGWPASAGRAALPARWGPSLRASVPLPNANLATHAWRGEEAYAPLYYSCARSHRMASPPPPQAEAAP